jgi:hypothetical protein
MLKRRLAQAAAKISEYDLLKEFTRANLQSLQARNRFVERVH